MINLLSKQSNDKNYCFQLGRSVLDMLQGHYGDHDEASPRLKIRAGHMNHSLL